jgi:hypothetical protein
MIILAFNTVDQVDEINGIKRDDQKSKHAKVVQMSIVLLI